MIHLVSRLLRWCLKRGELHVEDVPDLERNFVVKSQARYNGRFGAERAIRGGASARIGQAYDVQSAPVTASGNAVNETFPAFSQVDDERLLVAFDSHQGLSVGCGIGRFGFERSKDNRTADLRQSPKEEAQS